MKYLFTKGDSYINDENKRKGENKRDKCKDCTL